MMFPFLRRNDARDQVERKNPFRALRIAIDVEGDALAQKGEVHRLAFGVKILAGEAAEGGMEFLVMVEGSLPSRPNISSKRPLTL